jgi:hypothetical protein
MTEVQTSATQSVDFKIIERIQKLLNLAAKNPNKAEADAAAAKAQELLTQYNLDAATVGSATDSGRREEAKVRGGFYQYQRDLYRAVAELNFCFYWHQEFIDETQLSNRIRLHMPKAEQAGYFENGKVKRRWWGRKQFRHVFVGRVVNTAATRVMATYLEQAVERACRERLGENGEHLFSRWAISFREGAVEELVGKISERFYDRLRKEQAELRKAQRAAGKAEDDANAPTGSTAVTLHTLVKSEADANYDFIHGEGAAARWHAEKAAAAQEAKERREAYTKWAKANPEEARRREEEARKAEEKRARRYRGGPAEKERDYNALRAGREAGRKIGIDQQAGTTKVAGVLR